MTTFSGPAPVDMLYMRVKGSKRVWSVALCEVMLGKLTEYNPPDNISIHCLANMEINYTEPEFLQKINNEMKPLKIESFALLMEGEISNPTLTLFLDKNS